MNKYLIFIVVLLLIIVAGFYFIKNNNIEEKPLPQENIDSNEVFNNGNLKIIESKVSYSVDKIFFNKPGEKVVGVTNDINGSLNYEENIISANLVVPTLNLITGQNKRDEDVRKLIGENIKIEVKEQELSFPFENKIPILITIGDKTNEVLFDVIVKEEGNIIYFSGNSKISMKSFGIDSPSMLEIYQVSDEVDLAFELKAEK